MAERKWTPSQKNAVEAENGTVLVAAAAGSGKTSVLVERIVRKLTSSENAVSPDSLLVVTFTNAAAQEMRSRIYLRISKKAQEEPERRSDYVTLLSKLNEMQVCTMDSFCMKLVKENSYELGIDADFLMLEQGENESLKNKTAVSVLERRFKENADTFIPLARMFDSGKNDSRLIETVIKLSDFAKSEPYPENWLDEIGNRFSETDAESSIWGKYIIEEVREALVFCSELFGAAMECIREDEQIYKCYYEIFESERELVKKAISDFDASDWDSKVAVISELFRKISANRLKSVPRGYADNPSKLGATVKRDYVKDILKKLSGYMNITVAEHTEDLFVLKEIAKELIVTVKEYDSELLRTKKEMSKYDFSDIAHFALKLLCDINSPDGKTELAREKTQELSEILIDEYQDTNRAQDTLFASISKNGENMFLVGDVKQSIYRFRLASPEIFIEKCEAFPYYDGREVKSKIILGENFRSRKGILDCVNFVFSQLMTPSCGDIDYNDDEKLNFPAVKTPSDTSDVEVTVLETGEEKAYITEARYIAHKIHQSITDGITVEDGGQERKAVPSDFCILLRSPSGIAKYYAEALKNRSIPVSSDVSVGFFENPEIKTVLSYMRVIDNPVRDVDMAAVMMSPLFGFDADDLARLRVVYGRNISLYAAVLLAAKNGDAKCIHLAERINYYQRCAVNMTVDMLLREIYSDTAYFIAAGAMPDGATKQKNLRRLIEKAEGSSESFSGLTGFVRYIDMLRENKAEISNTGGSTGVRIMSMHKSKGLEFPFVFIAGTSKMFNKSDIRANLIINHETGLGIKRKEPENIKTYDTLSSVALRMNNNRALMSEELRVYYVALTRAKQKLYITLPYKNAVKSLAESEYLLSKTEGISPYLIKHASDARSWLLKCFIRHPDGKALRMFADTVFCASGKADIKLEEECLPEVIVNDVVSQAEADKNTVERIREKASFRYKWLEIADARTMHTASSLDDEHFDPAGFAKSVPAFMFSSALSPADIGTLTHRFLQFCDFNVCKQNVKKEVERLTREGYFNEKQAQAVDIGAIEAFVNSSIMKRIGNAKTVLREKQFTLSKSICEADCRVPSEFCGEKTVIIGKIDLLFTEDDGAVIVDYKTDNVSDTGILAERYRTQMLLYIEALEKAMDIKVKECVLYSIRLKSSVSLSF